MIEFAAVPSRLIGAAGRGEGNQAVLAALDNGLVYATELAERIRTRITREANTDGVPVAYSTKRRKIRVSRAYQRAVGLPGNRVVWRSSAEWHAAAGMRPGTFLGTGGMFAGVAVRNKGLGAVVTELDGRSLGQSVRWRKPLKDIASGYREERERIAGMKAGKRRENAVAKLRGYFDKYLIDANQVRNNDKALGALRKGVHVLAPSESELAACHEHLATRLLSAATAQQVASLEAAHLGAVAVVVDPGAPVGDEAMRRQLAAAF